MPNEVKELLKRVIVQRASDLHLRVPSLPVLRVDGRLVPQEDCLPLTNSDTQKILEAITTPEQLQAFERDFELDFAYSLYDIARFRVNAMKQKGSVSLAFRMIPMQVPSVDDLGLPTICKSLVLKPRGLVLVTGRTGSGKSTTLAAMINHLNETERRNIVTIEDPIEYLHQNKKSLIAQRELGEDTKSFAIALKHALRHDPDVVVVGEMRDLETISIAISAAETGHLVLGTLHTPDASQTVDRVIDIFPPAQQQQIRLQFSQVLEAVLSQVLLPRADGKGRIAAFEIMMGTPAVRNIIREGKTFELANVMQLGSKSGMETLDQALANIVKKGLVSRDVAMEKSSNPERLLKLLQYQ